MSTVGHVAVAIAVGRYAWDLPASRRRLAAMMLGCVVLAVLPDIDFLAQPLLGTDPDGAFGHRGATHSLAFAILAGVVVGLLLRLGRRAAVRAALVATGLVMSHPLLDMLTANSPGVALLWPLSDVRFLSPWRPLPIAPIGPALFSSHGLTLLLAEAAVFLPFWAYALWPRHAPPYARNLRQ